MLSLSNAWIGEFGGLGLREKLSLLCICDLGAPSMLLAPIILLPRNWLCFGLCGRLYG